MDNAENVQKKRLAGEASKGRSMSRKQPTLRVIEPATTRHRAGAAYSLPAAAKEIGVSYKTLRRAIELDQVRVVSFGGLVRVSKSEIERIRRMFEGDAP